jgi:hypothetical protein
MTTRSLLAVLALTAPLALGACVSDGGGAASGGLAGSNAGSGSGSGSGGSLASRTPSTATTVTGSARARNLVGKSDGEVRSELGAPAFRRTDGPAQVWQYRGNACLLDVFLYKEGSGGFRVKHAELRRRGGAGLSDSACMSDALTNRARS